jgi:hypothetical protein
MRFRWEFVVSLNGWGETAKDAWDGVSEGISQDGMGEPPMEIMNSLKAIRKALLSGPDYAVRCEPDERAPDDTLLVWDDVAIKPTREKQ